MADNPVSRAKVGLRITQGEVLNLLAIKWNNAEKAAPAFDNTILRYQPLTLFIEDVQGVQR